MVAFISFVFFFFELTFQQRWAFSAFYTLWHLHSIAIAIYRMEAFCISGLHYKEIGYDLNGMFWNFSIFHHITQMMETIR